MKKKDNIKFETLHKSYKKKIIIGVVVVCIVGSVLVFKTTRAKYRFTQNIPFVRGVINYKPYDFKMMAMYQQKDGSTCTEDSCYNEIEVMPEGDYRINEAKSYCTKDGTNKDTQAILKTIDGNHTIAKLSKNEKCYLYFDDGRNVQYILAKYTKAGARSNYQILTTDNSGKVFSLDDDDGTSYYFAGAVNNNWVKFAGFYWRIIRFNGDKSVRLIYSGTTAATTGTVTQLSSTSAFNSTRNDNMYVGYRYTSGDAHGFGTASTIQGVIDAWYETHIVNKGYSSKVETKAGFCGDRDAYKNNTGTISGGGTGGASTYYGAYIRFRKYGNAVTNPTPTYKCKYSSDLYTVNGATKGNKSLTYPVGLITADEVNAAGATFQSGNTSYYLYTENSYWTMSPCSGSTATVFVVSATSGLNYNDVDGVYGVRPVINLRADTLFSGGDGTSSNPWVVQ